MSNENEDRPGSGISLAVIREWIPTIAIILGLVYTFSKRDEKTDFLITQNGELQSMVRGLTEDLRKVSERLARVEAVQESNRRSLDQDQSYRQQVQK